MIKIFLVTDDDANARKIMDANKAVEGDNEGEFYKIEYKGQIFYLNRHVCDFTLYDLQGDSISYKKFFIDENYRVSSILLDNYAVLFAKDHLAFQDFRRYRYQINLNAKEQFFTFVQESPNRNECVGLLYPLAEAQGNYKIFPLIQRKPTHFFVKKKGRMLKTYSLVEAERGSFFYDATAIREFGLQTFLKRGSYSLMKEDFIYRYVRSYGKKKHFTFGDFAQPYKEEEMYALLESKGFQTSIPEEILSFYNEFTEESIADYVAIAKAFEEWDKELGCKLSFQKKAREQG